MYTHARVREKLDSARLYIPDYLIAAKPRYPRPTLRPRGSSRVSFRCDVTRAPRTINEGAPIEKLSGWKGLAAALLRLALAAAATPTDFGGIRI